MSFGHKMEETIYAINQPFKYPPQPLRDDEIRLLVLPPRSNNNAPGLISCQFLVVKLGDEPTYEALSYTWGPEDPAERILIHNCVQLVRPNLCQALNILQNASNGGLRYLWIDALCINQKNVLERDHQVAQMGKIYKQAQIVLVWLGPGNTTSSSAIRLLSKMSRWSRIRSSYNHVNRRMIANRRLTHLLVNERRTAAFTAILDLCCQDYWTRVWIIQEIVLANDILLMCGNLSLPWASFEEALSAIYSVVRRVPYGSLEPGVAFVQLQILQSQATGLYGQRRRRLGLTTDPPSLGEDSLYDLFIQHQGAECSETKDKIFGLSALTKECCRSSTPVNYSLTLRTLCGQLVYHHLTMHKDGGVTKTDVLDCLQEVQSILEAHSSRKKVISPRERAETADLLGWEEIFVEQSSVNDL